MAKPRIYGMKTACIPNAKADARYNKKFFEHGKAYAESDEERAQKRWNKEVKRFKKGLATQ